MNYPWPFQTQFDATGSGRNDCFEACLAAYLKANGTIPPSTSDAATLNAVSLACRQQPDEPYNAETNLNQADQGLQHYNLPVQLTYDWTRTMSAPWSILLVDGTVLRLRDGTEPYPESFFNGSTGPNHFILSGPVFQGNYDYCMNPLAVVRAWARYDLGTVKAAFTCAYLLPAIKGTKPSQGTRWTATRRFGLLSTPAHGSTALAVVPQKGTGLTWGEQRTVAGQVWQRVQWRSSVGWTLAAYLA